MHCIFFKVIITTAIKDSSRILSTKVECTYGDMVCERYHYLRYELSLWIARDVQLRYITNEGL